MDINQISVAIRPRNHWEAIDLGFRLARQHWRELYGASLAVFVPLVGLIYVLVGPDSWWAFLLVWWLKPVYERVPLIVLSRAVFGSTPSIGEVLRALPEALRSGVFTSLLWLRFDPSRAFNLPVWQLEGLKGRSRSQRVRTIGKRTAGASTWLTFVCLSLEAIVWIASFSMIAFMTPEQLEFDWFGWLFDDAPPSWFGVLIIGLYAAAVGFIGPLYVAGGFTLYLNRRTILEGWDIEIAFRRMAPRIAAATRSEAA